MRYLPESNSGRLNILYLTEFMTAIGGGGEVAFSTYAREMASRGHHVDIVCHKSTTDKTKRNEDKNMIIHRLGPRINLHHGSFPNLAQQILYIANMARVGRQIVSRNKIEVIHANTLSPAIAGGILAVVCGIPLVVTFHHVGALKSCSSKQMSQAHSENIARVFRSFYERLILSLPASCVHAVSDSTASDLWKFGYNGNIEVIPNGLDFGEFTDSGECAKSPYLLFVGRLVKSKNLDVVIDAFAAATNMLPHAKLVIVGDGPMYKEWKTRAEKLGVGSKVKFVGYMSEKEKRELIRKCSALVFPSTQEGFGLVALEAFAFGKPVLASDIPSLREIVRDSVDGFVLSPFSTIEWKNRMQIVLSMPELSERMGNEGRKRVIRKFSVKDAGDALESLYGLLVKNSKTVPAIQ